MTIYYHTVSKVTSCLFPWLRTWLIHTSHAVSHIAANLLTTVDESFQCVPELLISMALIDGSTSSSSVFFALMAVSALFMQNPAQALSYRQRAKSMLDTVQLEGLEFRKALQQIAASMLLCLFDVSILPSLRGI
jgi:hypothetical protein